MSSDTYKRLVLDAGQIRIGYVDEDNPGALLGATRGGTVFEVMGDLRDMPADGAKGVVKGSERVTRVTASLSVTVIEFVSWILRMALPGSQRANWPVVTPTHDEIGRYLTFALADYNDTVALIAEVNGTSEPVVLILRNVIGKGGLTAALVQGDEAGIKLKLEAHFDPAETSEEPWTVRNPGVFVDFEYEHLGGNEVKFTPIISGGWLVDSYEWDFGDGSAHSSEVSPVHDYGA
jgi:hypothetical protein